MSLDRPGTEHRLEQHLKQILEAALAAADPGEAVRGLLRVKGGIVLAGEGRFEPERVFVLAVGKAAGAMARSAEEVLGNRVTGGLIVTKEGHEASSAKLEVICASHPEPDERGVEAARKVQDLAESLGENDLLLALISGGASALLADPAPPIELADLKKLTGDLLKSGASIGEINVVRKHVCVLKGGGLVRLAAPAQTLALLLSDVVGDDHSSIASGPTAPDPTTLYEARSVLRRYGIEPPESVAAHLERAEETLKPGDPLFGAVASVVVGSGRHACEAAAQKARDCGYEPLLLSTSVTGEARSVAGFHAAVVQEVLQSGHPVSPPCALISGGEVTVVVGGGRGRAARTRSSLWRWRRNSKMSRVGRLLRWTRTATTAPPTPREAVWTGRRPGR